jgi:hypothetical protein
VAAITSQKLKPPPFNLTMYKGHKDAAITRSTTEFFLRSSLGKTFLYWLQSGVGFPEEYFFATLSRVSQRLYEEHNFIAQST